MIGLENAKFSCTLVILSTCTYPKKLCCSIDPRFRALPCFPRETGTTRFKKKNQWRYKKRDIKEGLGAFIIQLSMYHFVHTDPSLHGLKKEKKSKSKGPAIFNSFYLFDA